jgi:hypothetical protein
VDTKEQKWPRNKKAIHTTRLLFLEIQRRKREKDGCFGEGEDAVLEVSVFSLEKASLLQFHVQI